MPPALATLAPGNAARRATRVGTLERYESLQAEKRWPAQQPVGKGVVIFSRTRRGWTAACLLGFGTLFVAFSLGALFRFLFWPSHWPDIAALPSVDPTTGFGGVDPQLAAKLYWANAAYHLVHIPVFGGLIGWLQVRALRTAEIRPRSWVLLTALGFASVFVFEIVRPGIVTGGHPAPMEPLLIGIGGGGLAGVYQWLYLRQRGIFATKWLALWIVGLCAGAVLGALVLTLLGFLGPFVQRVLSENALFAAGQFVFYLVYGPTLGATAGFLSGRAMMEALPAAPEARAA